MLQNVTNREQKQVSALCVYTVPSVDLIFFLRWITYTKVCDFFLSKVDDKAADGYFSAYFNCVVLFKKKEKKDQEKVP